MRNFLLNNPHEGKILACMRIALSATSTPPRARSNWLYSFVCVYFCVRSTPSVPPRGTVLWPVGVPRPRVASTSRITFERLIAAQIGPPWCVEMSYHRYLHPNFCLCNSRCKFFWSEFSAMISPWCLATWTLTYMDIFLFVLLFRHLLICGSFVWYMYIVYVCCAMHMRHL